MAVKVSMVAAGLAASALVVGVAATGCGNDKSSSPSSTTSSPATTTSAASTSPSSAAPAPTSGAAQPSDYSNLLIKPTDIVVPGDTFTLTKTGSDPSTPGISGEFGNQNGSRTIKVLITVYPDAAAAARDNDSNAKNLDMFLKATPTPADVGTGGAIAVGPSPDGSKAAAVVVFAEGKATALILFESAPNDPLPPDFVLDIGRKQDAAIKSGLPA
jgi:hypothetical protein